MTQRYVMILGQGRSGTNWLLDLFNLSEKTFCRNEPDKTPGSPLADLREIGTVCAGHEGALSATWDGAMQWTGSHMGERDPQIMVDKQYLWPVCQRLGATWFFAQHRLRRMVGLLSPAWRQGEWLVPRWMGSRRRLAEALLVLKVNQVPGWAYHVMEHAPDVPIFHIVRHPGGFLNSWKRRYVATRDQHSVEQNNIRRLKMIAEVDKGWGRRFGPIDALSMEASELWYWRYANETVYEMGQSHGRYLRVVYEQLATDPVAVLRDAYALCDLSWNTTMEKAAASSAVESTSIAGKWRQRLSEQEIELVEQALEASPMKSWWESDADTTASATPLTALG